MNKTSNYSLKLPEKSEQYNIEYFNDNNKVIDEQLKINSDDIDTINEQLLEEIEDRKSTNNTLQSNIDAKLNKNQNPSNRGKVMEVSNDGELKPSGLYHKTYITLAELGLTGDATVDDVLSKLQFGETFIASVTQFSNYQTLFPYNSSNDRYSNIVIQQGTSLATAYVKWFRKDGSREALANLNSNNKVVGWKEIIVENSSTDPYSCTGYTVLTGTEDLFTLTPGHYASAKVDKAYNYPVTDSSNVLAHIYVIGSLNEPANNKGYRIILYFDNKSRMYRINEWWGSFSNGWEQIISGDLDTTITKGSTNLPTSNAVYQAIKSDYDKFVYICNTSATDSSKTITVPNIVNGETANDYNIATGTKLTVCFKNGNGVAKPYLKVTSEGKTFVRAIVCNDFGTTKQLNSRFGSLTSGAYIWSENLILDLYYNGTNWVVIGDPIVSEIKENHSFTDFPTQTGQRHIKVYLSGYKEVKDMYLYKPSEAGTGYYNKYYSDWDLEFNDDVKINMQFQAITTKNAGSSPVIIQKKANDDFGFSVSCIYLGELSSGVRIEKVESAIFYATITGY